MKLQLLFYIICFYGAILSSCNSDDITRSNTSNHDPFDNSKESNTPPASEFYQKTYQSGGTGTITEEFKPIRIMIFVGNNNSMRALYQNVEDSVVNFAKKFKPSGNQEYVKIGLMSYHYFHKNHQGQKKLNDAGVIVDSTRISSHNIIYMTKQFMINTGRWPSFHPPTNDPRIRANYFNKNYHNVIIAIATNCSYDTKDDFINFLTHHYNNSNTSFKFYGLIHPKYDERVAINNVAIDNRCQNMTFRDIATALQGKHYDTFEIKNPNGMTIKTPITNSLSEIAKNTLQFKKSSDTVYTVKHNITSITQVTMDGSALSTDKYSFSGKKVTITSAQATSKVVIEYTH